MNGQPAPRAVSFDDDDEPGTTAAAPAAAAQAASREPVTIDQPAAAAAAAAPAAAAAAAPVAEAKAVAAAPVAEAAPAQLPAVAAERTTALSTQSKGGASRFQQELAEDGFEGVTLGFGSLPQVVLDKEKFKVSTDGNVVLSNSRFECTLHSSKVKWIFKNVQPGKSDPDKEDFVYSYDKVTATDGRPVADVIEGWKGQGWGHECKEYRDVTAQITGCDNAAYLQRLVLLSIPPNSINRFNGHLVTMKAQGHDYRTVPTVIEVGPEIQGVQKFNPWVFTIKQG